MKANFKNLFVLVLVGVMASACVQRRNAQGRIGKGRNSRSSGIYSGILATGGSAQANSTGFMGFVSNLSNPDGSSYRPNCGASQIQIAAKVNASTYGGDISDDGSEFHMSIAMSCPDAEGYSDLPLDIGPTVNPETFVGTSGYVSGGQAQIVFRDIFGAIILQGSVSGQNFSGEIYYENDFYWHNGEMVTPGASGSLGTFSMNACSIFNCTGI